MARKTRSNLAGGAAAFIGALGMAGAAQAQGLADLDIEFYLGAHGGVIDGDGKTYDNVPATYDYDSDTRGILGLLAGVNARSGALLFGVEGDVGFITDTKLDTCSSIGIPQFCRMSTNYHLRGRVGYSFGPLDLFVAAGGALLDTKISVLGTTDSETLTGYTLGAGGDYAVSDRAKVRLEVLRDDYGKKEFTPNNYGVKDWEDWTIRAAAIFTF